MKVRPYQMAQGVRLERWQLDKGRSSYRMSRFSSSIIHPQKLRFHRPRSQQIQPGAKCGLLWLFISKVSLGYGQANWSIYYLRLLACNSKNKTAVTEAGSSTKPKIFTMRHFIGKNLLMPTLRKEIYIFKKQSLCADLVNHRLYGITLLLRAKQA